MIKSLEDWDARVVLENYSLRESLRNDNSHFKGIRVALACLKAEIAKSTFEAASILSWTWSAITLKGFGVSNLRELGVSVSEHARNIVGIIASPFVYNDYAINTFLTLGPDETPQLPETEAEIGKLYAVAEAVDQVFTRLGIAYSACSGTVLGIERSRSFIKGDDDVDLLFDEKYLPQMNFLFDEGIFEKMTGIKVFNQKKHTNGWQCYHEAAKKPDGKNDVPANYFVDVMPVRDENGKFVFTHDDLRQRFLNDYMTVSELSELESKSFGPISLKAPKESRNYVVRAYREQGLKISYKFASHQVIGGAVANLTSPSHIWQLVKGIFETRRRIAITKPTSYDREVFEKARKDIAERICSFQDELKDNPELREKFEKNKIPYEFFMYAVYDAR